MRLSVLSVLIAQASLLSPCCRKGTKFAFDCRVLRPQQTELFDSIFLCFTARYRKKDRLPIFVTLLSFCGATGTSFLTPFYPILPQLTPSGLPAWILLSHQGNSGEKSQAREMEQKTRASFVAGGSHFFQR